MNKEFSADFEKDILVLKKLNQSNESEE